MTVPELLKGLGSLVVLFLGVALLYALAKGSGVLALRSPRGTARGVRALWRNPRQAMVEAPFGVQRNRGRIPIAVLSSFSLRFRAFNSLVARGLKMTNSWPPSKPALAAATAALAARRWGCG